MHFVFIYFFLVYVGGCLSCRTYESKIIGGDLADLSQVPYTVKIRYIFFFHVCGGTIISPDWVVTAAHCINSVKYKADYQIQAGSNWVFFGSIHYCSKIIVHKSFDYISGDYDIALIKVSNPFKIGRVYTDAAALPAAGTRPKSNTMAKTAGWGIFTQIMGIPISSPYLRTVEVPIISKKKCARLYKKHSGSRNVSPRNICAGYLKGGKDACSGDSGGPLVIDAVLVGVVSWGSGCAMPRRPGVYTNVGSVRKWIKKQTGL